MTKYLIAGLMAAVAVPALAQVAPPMPPMTMGHDKVMTRAEVQGHVARMFAQADTNRDGVITKAEADAAHQAMSGKGQRAVKMAGHMKGGHGMGGMGMVGMGKGMGGKMFERADANHDGRLTLAEAQAQAFAHFDMMDTNRDGRITPKERQAAHQRMMQMHKSR